MLSDIAMLSRVHSKRKAKRFNNTGKTELNPLLAAPLRSLNLTRYEFSGRMIPEADQIQNETFFEVCDRGTIPGFPKETPSRSFLELYDSNDVWNIKNAI
jgi:hypothetical protein